MTHGWSAGKLVQLARVRSGFAFKSSQWTDAGVPVVKIGNVKRGRLDMDGCSFVTEDDAVRSGFLLSDGDILVGLTGYVGEVAKVRNLGPLVLNQRVGKFYPTSDCDPEFLFFLVSNDEFRQRVEAASHGSAQANVSPSAIEAFEVLIPPLPEQRAIAATLGALDDKIELNRKMNATLESLARALFRDWFADFGPTRAKMKGGKPYLAPELWSLFPDRLDENGIPEGWEVRQVADFATLRGGKQLAKEYIQPDGLIPVFGGAGVMGYANDHNADGFVISVGRVGAYCGQFFSHRGKAWINNNASHIRQHEGVSGEWLLCALQELDMNLIKKGAAQPFVSNGDISKMEILWPGERMVEEFLFLLLPIASRVEANNRESRTLARTRDLLLPRLMSGELRVNDAEERIEEVL